MGLSEKLFYNTGIPASIILINKSKPEALKNKVIFIDASKEYKDGKNQSSLTPENIEKVISSYDAGCEVEQYMRVVDMGEIADNDYNLNIARYIDISAEEALHHKALFP